MTDALKTLQNDTSDCSRFLLNICLSYGSRSEIVNACRSIVTDVQAGELLVHEIDERQFGSRLQIGNIRCDTKTLPDPDVLIRTSGEYRISNFLLWQLAYTELFFVKKQWPELEKKDLISIVRKFATSRQRRYGK